MVCDCHPDNITFSFGGGNCDNSTNDQNGRFSCSDLGALGPVGSLALVSANADVTDHGNGACVCCVVY